MDLTVFMHGHEADCQFFYYHVFQYQAQIIQNEEADEIGGLNQSQVFLSWDEWFEVYNHTRHMTQKQSLQMDHTMMTLINVSKKDNGQTHIAVLLLD
jgi:hypothetical protein